MINNVVLTGRLTKEIDLRYTQTGTAVGSLNLAVDRQFKKQDGERETDFVNCIIWRKAAENLASFTRKGSLIGVQGRIQTRNYENQQGVRVYVTEVVIENFTLLESREVTESRPRQNSQDSNRYQQNSQTNQQSQQQNSNNNNQRNNNFSDYASKEDPFLSSGQSIDISDDDLPF